MNSRLLIAPPRLRIVSNSNSVPEGVGRRFRQMSALCREQKSRLLRTSVTLAVMFICRRCGRDEIGVRIAPAAIACQHNLPALFNRIILTVPVHAFCAVLYHGAPRGFGGGGRLQTKDQRGEYGASGERSGHIRPPWSVSVITPNGMAAFQSGPR